MIEEARQYLNTLIPATSNELKDDLRTANKYLLTVLEDRAQKHSELVQAREKYRHPTEKGITDFDRRIMLDSDIATQLEAYERSDALCEALRARLDSISLCIK